MQGGCEETLLERAPAVLRSERGWCAPVPVPRLAEHPVGCEVGQPEPRVHRIARIRVLRRRSVRIEDIDPLPNANGRGRVAEVELEDADRKRSVGRTRRILHRALERGIKLRPVRRERDSLEAAVPAEPLSNDPPGTRRRRRARRRCSRSRWGRSDRAHRHPARHAARSARTRRVPRMTRHADDEAFAVDAVLCRSQVVSAVGGVRRGLGRDATSGLVLRVDLTGSPVAAVDPKRRGRLSF